MFSFFAKGVSVSEDLIVLASSHRESTFANIHLSNKRYLETDDLNVLSMYLVEKKQYGT